MARMSRKKQQQVALWKLHLHDHPVHLNSQETQEKWWSNHENLRKKTWTPRKPHTTFGGC